MRSWYQATINLKGGKETVESIEASGKSVDEAVLQALARLGRRRDEVEVTVLQQAFRGTFGVGSKEARVRVTVRPSTISAVITPEMADAILGPDDTFPEEEIYDDEVEGVAFEDGDEEFFEGDDAEDESGEGLEE